MDTPSTNSEEKCFFIQYRKTVCLCRNTVLVAQITQLCDFRKAFSDLLTNPSLQYNRKNEREISWILLEIVLYSFPDFSKGSYRYAPMVAFFASHTYGMTTPGPIRFNNLDVNYGASFAPASGKFHVPYLGVYVFEYTIESFSPRASGYLVIDGIDKLSFQAENINSNKYTDRVITGNALLELNYGQEVWLRLVAGSIPAKYPPVTTFSGYLLYRT